MTLDEAIKHAEEVAETQRSNAHMYEDMMVYKQAIKHSNEAECYEESMNECIECAEEHRQLAEWLKDYKRLLEQEPSEDCVSRQKVEIQEQIIEKQETLIETQEERIEIQRKIIDKQGNIIEKLKEMCIEEL